MVSGGGDWQVVWVSGGGGFVTDVGVGQVVQQRQRRRGSMVGFCF